MAYLEDTEEEKQAEPGSMAQSAQITGQPAAPTGGQQAPGSASKQPQGSGSFVNLQKYIDANKPKTQQMTQAITQGITGQAGQLDKDIKRDISGFQAGAKIEEGRIGAGGWQAPGQESAPDLSGGPARPTKDLSRSNQYKDSSGNVITNEDFLKDMRYGTLATPSVYRPNDESFHRKNAERQHEANKRIYEKYGYESPEFNWQWTPPSEIQPISRDNLKQQTPYYQQLIDKAGSGTLTPEEKERFRQIRTGEGLDVKGPDLADERRRALDLSRRAGAFGTTEGRLEELQKTVGGQSSNYGGGQRKLDALLLGGDRANRAKALKDVRGATSGFQSQLDTAQSTAQARISDIADKRRKLSEDIMGTKDEQGNVLTQGALGKARAAINQEISDAVKAKNDELQQVKDYAGQGSVAQALGGMGIDNELTRALGRGGDALDRETFGLLTNEQFQDLMGAGQYGEANVMNQAQLNRRNALRGLAGQTEDLTQLDSTYDPYANVRDVMKKIQDKKAAYKLARVEGEKGLRSVDEYLRLMGTHTGQKEMQEYLAGGDYNYDNTPAGGMGMRNPDEVYSTRETGRINQYTGQPEIERYVDPAKVKARYAEAERVRKRARLKRAQDLYSSDYKRMIQGLEGSGEDQFNVGTTLGDQLNPTKQSDYDNSRYRPPDGSKYYATSDGYKDLGGYVGPTGMPASSPQAPGANAPGTINLNDFINDTRANVKLRR